MRRLRLITSCVNKRFSAFRGRSAVMRDKPSKKAERVTRVIRNRQLNGETTSLRQIHKVTGLDQAEALNLVSQLEGEGTVVIEQNMADAFESVLTLSTEAKEQIDASVKDKAA